MDTTYQGIAERFARETADHELTILRDGGLYRHLRFKAPGSSGYWKACGFRLEDYDWGENASAEVMGAALHDLIVKQRARKQASEALDQMEITANRLRQAVAEARKSIDAENPASLSPQAVPDAAV